MIISARLELLPLGNCLTVFLLAASVVFLLGIIVDNFLFGLRTLLNRLDLGLLLFRKLLVKASSVCRHVAEAKTKNDFDG